MSHQIAFLAGSLFYSLNRMVSVIRLFFHRCTSVNKLTLNGIIVPVDDLPGHIKPRVVRFAGSAKRMKRKDLEDIAVQYYATILMQESFSQKVERRLGRVEQQQCCRQDCPDRLNCTSAALLSTDIHK